MTEEGFSFNLVPLIPYSWEGGGGGRAAPPNQSCAQIKRNYNRDPNLLASKRRGLIILGLHYEALRFDFGAQGLQVRDVLVAKQK